MPRPEPCSNEARSDNKENNAGYLYRKRVALTGDISCSHHDFGKQTCRGLSGRAHAQVSNPRLWPPDGQGKEVSILYESLQIPLSNRRSGSRSSVSVRYRSRDGPIGSQHFFAGDLGPPKGFCYADTPVRWGTTDGSGVQGRQPRLLLMLGESKGLHSMGKCKHLEARGPPSCRTREWPSGELGVVDIA